MHYLLPSTCADSKPCNGPNFESKRKLSSVQTMWTSEKIDLVKNELKKYKDQIQSEELKKLKKDLLAGRDKKDPEGGEEVIEDDKKTTEAEKPLTPSRGTMPSTSHQARVRNEFEIKMGAIS